MTPVIDPSVHRWWRKRSRTCTLTSPAPPAPSLPKWTSHSAGQGVRRGDSSLLKSDLPASPPQCSPETRPRRVWPAPPRRPSPQRLWAGKQKKESPGRLRQRPPAARVPRRRCRARRRRPHPTVLHVAVCRWARRAPPRGGGPCARPPPLHSPPRSPLRVPRRVTRAARGVGTQATVAQPRRGKQHTQRWGGRVLWRPPCPTPLQRPPVVCAPSRCPAAKPWSNWCVAIGVRVRL